jgi:hypothetical protein
MTQADLALESRPDDPVPLSPDSDSAPFAQLRDGLIRMDP